MQILSATKAVAPAFSRTKLILITPFDWKRTWKLAATAYVSTVGTIYFPWPMMALAAFPLVRGHVKPLWAWAAVLGVLLLTTIFTWVFTLCSRLQFALFDIVLHRESFIRPLWEKYGERAQRWAWLKIGVGTAVLIVMAVPALLCLAYTFYAKRPGGMVVTIIVAIISYIAMSIFALAASIWNDFTMPSIALENISPEAASKRAWHLARNETGQVALYALMKLVLGFGGQLAINAAVNIAMEIIFIILSLIGSGIGMLLHGAGVPNLMLYVIGISFAGSFLLAFMLYVTPLSAGVVMTFLESYKLYFLGGRYPLLGEMLERSTPAPVLLAVVPTSYGKPYQPEPLSVVDDSH